MFKKLLLFTLICVVWYVKSFQSVSTSLIAPNCTSIKININLKSLCSIILYLIGGCVGSSISSLIGLNRQENL